ncbi:DUF1131 family protein [Pseudaestuariivita atlantica]|uniref:DUF1131 family protein n=1 Tax=Pseudaestuariivita atlantica TaxID=1317121 RepID=UPI0009E1ED03|nr:DUF1131 family protein [Pseudaestuariivita atlantica]
MSTFFPYRARPALLGLAMAILPAAATLADEAFRLSVHGLGGITADTRFDAAALSDAMPGVSFTSERQMTEDGTHEFFIARSKGARLFTVSGDGRGRVGAISTGSPRVANWLGPVVGDRYDRLDQNRQLGTCSPGAEAFSGKMLCAASESGQIIYVFSGRWSGPDGELPPRSVRAGWTVSQLIWRPERFAQTGTAPASTAGPSFDCARAEGSIETLICSDATLAGLDRALSTAYAQSLDTATMGQRKTLRAFQRGWIRARNECWKSGDPRRCVEALYQDRIAELTGTDATRTLDGTSWTGTRIAGDTLPPSIEITMDFDADGKVSGTSGCNRYFATYAVSGQSVRIAQIGSTRKLCPEPEMTAEYRFLDALERVNGWAMRNGDLVLFGSGAELTFTRR